MNLLKIKETEQLKRLRDSKSPDDIFLRKRDVANGILKYISIFSGVEFGSLEKPKVPETE